MLEVSIIAIESNITNINKKADETIQYYYNSINNE